MSDLRAEPPANSQDTEITLGVLDAVEQNATVTQRSVARELGIALGLANSYLRRCVRKGLIKVKQIPPNRYLYYLTPKGFAEKSRLTASYLAHSFSFFRRARQAAMISRAIGSGSNIGAISRGFPARRQYRGIAGAALMPYSRRWMRYMSHRLAAVVLLGVIATAPAHAASEVERVIESGYVESVSAPPQQSMQQEEQRLALFIDLDNVVIGLRDSGHAKFDVKLLISRLLEKGKIVIKRAYSDWNRYAEYKRAFHESAFELIEIPQRMGSVRKNAADIKMATQLARAMVTQYGMSDKLGPLAYGDNEEEVFLGHSIARTQNLSDETQTMVDEEIHRLVDEGFESARKIISENLDDLHTIARGLLEYETLSGEEIKDLLKGRPPVREFAAEVAELRDALERLEKRIGRLT